jgi:hypothetical protein
VKDAYETSLYYHFLLKASSKFLYNLCSETRSSRDTLHRQMPLHVSLLFVTTIVRCYLCSSHSAQQGPVVDSSTVEWTDNEYFDIRLTDGNCNSRAGTAAREYLLLYPGRRHPEAEVL